MLDKRNHVTVMFKETGMEVELPPMDDDGFFTAMGEIEEKQTFEGKAVSSIMLIRTY